MQSSLYWSTTYQVSSVATRALVYTMEVGLNARVEVNSHFPGKHVAFNCLTGSFCGDCSDSCECSQGQSRSPQWPCQAPRAQWRTDQGEPVEAVCPGLHIRVTGDFTVMPRPGSHPGHLMWPGGGTAWALGFVSLLWWIWCASKTGNTEVTQSFSNKQELWGVAAGSQPYLCWSQVLKGAYQNQDTVSAIAWSMWANSRLSPHSADRKSVV